MTQRDVETERKALALVERALEVGESKREAFIQAASEPPGVRARALEILVGVTAGEALIPTGGADAYAHIIAAPPERLGSYRILEEVGRGGMGAVYLAERMAGDFDHQVAIKVIATGKLSVELIARFERERQTLAKLNHPNIARLYDGGETDDGLPYLVMEFVKGQPLDRWLAQTPSQARRFSVLKQILTAVEHAHRALIIHRDLTPSNVIVSDEGVVKLIDFGISSFQSGAPGGVMSGQTATPGFAAPEIGHGDLPSTLLDIYALGKIIQTLFAVPTSPEITAISNKAAAQDPNQRYPSVRAIAQDVARYQTGRPVEAYEGGFGYRAGKYLRRHWLPVGAAVAIAVIMAMSVSLLARAYQQEQAARQLADRRFKDVRALAGTMMFDVYDAIDAIPNTVEARQLVARSSIDYLNNLAITPDAPADLRREVGEGWLRLSQVTGGSSGDQIGLPEEALSFGTRALQTLEDLHRDHPDDEAAQVSLGRALAIMALDSLYLDGDSETGYARAKRAVALLEDIEPKSERIASASARAYRALGDAYGWQNALPKAGQVYDTGQAFVRALPEALRDTVAVRLEMSSLMRQRAEVYRYTGAPEEAFAQMRATVDYNRETFERSSQSATAPARRNYVISLWNIADMSEPVARWESGLGYAQRARILIEDALRQSPGDVGWLELIPQINTAIAKLKSGQGDHAGAVDAADTTIATLREIREKSGASVGTDLALAVGWRDVAFVYERAQKSDIACAGLQEALTIFQTYDADGALSQYDRDNNMSVVIEALERC